MGGFHSGFREAEELERDTSTHERREKVREDHNIQRSSKIKTFSTNLGSCLLSLFDL